MTGARAIHNCGAADNVPAVRRATLITDFIGGIAVRCILKQSDCKLIGSRVYTCESDVCLLRCSQSWPPRSWIGAGKPLFLHNVIGIVEQRNGDTGLFVKVGHTLIAPRETYCAGLAVGKRLSLIHI